MAEGSSGGKPADFFVGLVDFFAILLPGAMLAFVLFKCVERWDATLTGISLPEGWVTFVAAGLVSYVLGHFLFIVASLCLDPLYDWWKETFRVWEDRGWTKPFNILWESLKERETLQEEANIPNLSLAATYLRVWSPGAASEMDRLEGDQKFFRGLILVFLCAWVAFLWSWEKGVWPWVGLMLLLFPMFPFRIFTFLTIFRATIGTEKSKEKTHLAWISTEGNSPKIRGGHHRNCLTPSAGAANRSTRGRSPAY